MDWYTITAKMEADRRNLTGPEREGFIAGCLYAAAALGPYLNEITNKSNNHIQQTPKLGFAYLLHP